MHLPGLFSAIMYDIFQNKTYLIYGLFIFLFLCSGLEYVFGIKARKKGFIVFTSVYLFLGFISLITHFVFMIRMGHKIEPTHILQAQQIITFIIFVAGSHELYRDFFDHNSKFNFIFRTQQSRGFRFWTFYYVSDARKKSNVEYVKSLLFNATALLFSFFMDSQLVWAWRYDTLYHKKFMLLGHFLLQIFR